jgi:catechol 2,3-dioxygenase-like lactoylglutathione lyase family enzyme
MPDVGLTHVALLVSHLDASLAFYTKYAAMQVGDAGATGIGPVPVSGDGP